MALRCGFYNAINSDRRYDALDISRMFDGLITDGVFETIGTGFIVTADGDSLKIKVGIGRAWFNHTWTYNDAILPIKADLSEVLLDRIDALVLEINNDYTVRDNTIKFVKGTPSSEPAKPTLTQTEDIHQYPLCYIYRTAGSEVITQSDITNCVGTSECPFVTGVIEGINTDQLILQWNAQFETWFSGIKQSAEKELNIYTGMLAAGSTSITITASAITTNSILSFFTSIYGVNPTSVKVMNGSVTMTFAAQTVDMKVGVSVDG